MMESTALPVKCAACGEEYTGAHLCGGPHSLTEIVGEEMSDPLSKGPGEVLMPAPEPKPLWVLPPYEEILRDFFAGCAMINTELGWPRNERANIAWLDADAMLAAKKAEERKPPMATFCSLCKRELCGGEDCPTCNAAPEMLAMLKELEDTIASLERRTRIAALIKKAEGETT